MEMQLLTVEEKLDECEEQEASNEIGVLVRLPMDVGPQEQRGSDDCHESHLHV